jgi:hypothetical protein
VIEVARHIIGRHFPDAELRFDPPVPQDPTNRRPDLTLAGRLIPGWTCNVSFEDGIDRTVAGFRAELVGDDGIGENADLGRRPLRRA